jgi:hypothetical protein
MYLVGTNALAYLCLSGSDEGKSFMAKASTQKVETK